MADVPFSGAGHLIKEKHFFKPIAHKRHMYVVIVRSLLLVTWQLTSEVIFFMITAATFPTHIASCV